MNKETRFSNIENKKTYVFGSGRFADKFVECYRNDYNIVGIVDNDPKKHGVIWKSYRINSPETLRTAGDCHVVVCIKNSEPIVNQLTEMGINDVAVFDAHHIYPGRQANQEILRGDRQYHIGFFYVTSAKAIEKNTEILFKAKSLCDYLMVGIPVPDSSNPEQVKASAELIKRIESVTTVDELIMVPVAYSTTIDLLEKYHYDLFITDQKLNTPYWIETKKKLNQNGAELLYLPGRSRENRGERKLLSTYDSVKRLGIYAFYDKDGIVDDYVIRFVKSFTSVTERTIVVSNGTLTKEGSKALKKLGCELLIRENKGFDAWGVRTGLFHVGFDTLGEYDEILIANNTVFGPIYDLSVMLNEMASRDLDFWGCSAHPGFATSDPYGSNPYGYVPEHVQSYFYAVRRPLVLDECFRSFWEKLPELPDYSRAVGLYETFMTKYFSDDGFLWDVYMPREEYYDMTDNPLITMPAESVKKWKCPFVKRRAFFQDYDYYSTYTGQQTVSCLLQFIEEETDYPRDLIFQNLIRTCHMSVLVQDLHLAKILDKKGDYGKQCSSKKKTALFMHIYDTSMLPTLRYYVNNLPERTHIHISTTSESKKTEILDAFANRKNIEVRVLPNIGRDVSALLVSFRDVVFNYDYICVTHDKKTSHLKPECVGEGFAYMGYENILASKDFVESVFKAFDSDPFLGLLYAPDPNHADFASHIGLEWGKNYDSTLALYQKLGLTVPIDRNHPPMAPFGSSFWCRTEALRALYNKNWTYEDFPKEPINETDGLILQAIERIYPYTAQQAGLYSALLMTTDYAAIEIDNLQYYAQGYTHACYENGISGYYYVMRDLLNIYLDNAKI